MSRSLISIALTLTVSLLGCSAQETSCEDWLAFTDTPAKSSVWAAISRRDSRYVMSVIKDQPCAAKARAHDGRGPLFWAYEFGNMKLAAELVARGADLHAKDGQGNTPEDLKGPVVDYDAYFDGEEEEDEDYEEEEEEEEEDYEEDEQEQTADDPKAEL